MSVFDWLRKLGIVRVGAESASYHDATQRPLSFQESGVMNSEKDVRQLGKPAGSRPAAPQADVQP